MKLLKPMFFIFSLLLVINSFSKIYINDRGEKLFEGEKFPVLDACIILDRLYFDGKDWSSKEKGIWSGAINGLLLYGQAQQEIFIVSSTLIRDILDLSKEEWPLPELLRARTELLKNLNSSEWLMYETNNQEFVVLIPIQKYPELKIKNDLKKIGINPANLCPINKIDQTFYDNSKKKQIAYIEEESKKNNLIKNYGTINIKELLGIFLESEEGKKISKRIYIAGHGNTQTEKTLSTQKGPVEIEKPKEVDIASYVAQLSPAQYVKFLEYMQKINTSFLYVNSCFSGGWNALALQSASFYDQQEIFKKFENSTKNISFIIAVSSTSDTTSEASGSNIGITTFKINQFFTDINQFFQRQKEGLIDYLRNKNKTIEAENKNAKAINKKDGKILIKAKKLITIPDQNKISEVDILTGKYVTYEILNPTTGLLIEENVSLIEQNPKLINSEIEKIAANVTPKTVQNIQAIKFPGLPFFRAMIEKPSAKVKRLEEVIKKKEDYYQENPEISRLGDEIKGAQEEIKKTLESGQMAQNFIRIDYPFMLKHHIKGAILKTPAIKTKTTALLIYPSIVDLSITIIKPKSYATIGSSTNEPKIVSMIAGRAQHYIESLIFDQSTGKTLTNVVSTFQLANLFSTKLFFIENLVFEKNKNEFKNFALKISAGSIDYVYKKGPDYFSNSGKITAEKAKTTIKNWILQTTPAKEAIHEATAGIENIYKFRIKINQISDPLFGNMFKPEELKELKPEVLKEFKPEEIKLLEQKVRQRLEEIKRQREKEAEKESKLKKAPAIPDKSKRPAPPIPQTKPVIMLKKQAPIAPDKSKRPAPPIPQTKPVIMLKKQAPIAPDKSKKPAPPIPQTKPVIKNLKPRAEIN